MYKQYVYQDLIDKNKEAVEIKNGRISHAINGDLYLGPLELILFIASFNSSDISAPELP